LQTGETAIADGDNLGTIQFQAPDESSATDSRLVAAAIDAVAEAEFTGGVNKTKLVFRTAESETATIKATLTHRGALNLAGWTGGNAHQLKCTSEHIGASAGVALFQNTHSSVEAGDEVMRVQFSGDDDATGGHFINFFDSGGDIGRINVNGATQTAYAVSSDYRLKENIVDLDNAINRLKEIQPRRFSFIRQAGCTLANMLLEDGDSVLAESENMMTDGFVAHELQDDIPDAVDGAKDATKIVSVLYKEGDDIPDGSTIGDDTGVTEVKPFIQAVDYAKLTPLLTAALKEAIAKIEVLEAKVQVLEDA
jgi:hypothetical protein